MIRCPHPSHVVMEGKIHNYMDIRKNSFSRKYNCQPLGLKFMAWSWRTRFFSNKTRNTLQGDNNAYEILGVSSNSSYVEIKAAFRQLAKKTHPDLHSHLQPSEFENDRFVRILAAYEILSDPQKRAQYDAYLLLQRNTIGKECKKHPAMHRHDTVFREFSRAKHMEVVEWLKWYRHAVNDVVSQKEIGMGSGLQEYLQGTVHSAIRAAYFGPSIKSTYTLPDCFEAEERSDSTVSEILHLVSGRHLFGFVCFADRIFMPPQDWTSNKSCLPAYTMPMQTSVEQMCTEKKLKKSNQQSFQEENIDVLNHLSDICQIQGGDESLKINQLDTYKDLELHLFGKVVARATRVHPKQFHDAHQGKNSQDCISVFLEADETTSNIKMSYAFGSNSKSTSCGSPSVLVGTIYGLGTTPQEGTCSIYGADGKQTHMIVLHRTPLVKHMHWYHVGENSAACECRCTRARLPPSKFWIFEPRCEKHNIGGWYVETFGRNKRGEAIPYGRHWQSQCDYDGSKTMGRLLHENSQGKLHPAMYIMVLAYRTLDLEAIRAHRSSQWLS